MLGILWMHTGMQTWHAVMQLPAQTERQGERDVDIHIRHTYVHAKGLFQDGDQQFRTCPTIAGLEGKLWWWWQWFLWWWRQWWTWCLINHVFFYSIQFSCKAPGGRTKLGRDSSHCPRCADHQFPLPTWDDSRLVLIWFVMVWNIFYFPCIENNNPNWLLFFRGVGQPPTRHVWHGLKEHQTDKQTPRNPRKSNDSFC